MRDKTEHTNNVLSFEDYKKRAGVKPKKTSKKRMAKQASIVSIQDYLKKKHVVEVKEEAPKDLPSPSVEVADNLVSMQAYLQKKSRATKTPSYAFQKASLFVASAFLAVFVLSVAQTVPTSSERGLANEESFQPRQKTLKQRVKHVRKHIERYRKSNLSR